MEIVTTGIQHFIFNMNIDTKMKVIPLRWGAYFIPSIL
jgi:hypothetical protein